ncbi:hypothetical protein N7495_007639 [Penicillium taxi]|uniref:uncharacterized protein n=1 Tax=Penicillium taxi TaxID=168475 RepID=UPI002545A005|nr:uncharacterized protein N7495_007639 [Penicillium taxi]KAJ5887598.1 hypothetical protein N7495_007639 [Penicillium taxi]
MCQEHWRSEAETEVRVVVELLEDGVDPNIRDVNGVTPLILASIRGIVDVAATLIQAGADVNSADNVGATPIFGATLHDQEEVVKLLLTQETADVNLRINGYTPLMVAAQNKFLGILNALLHTLRWSLEVK